MALSPARVLPFLLMVAAPVAASAHTIQDEAACTQDVYRLCRNEIPNVSRIVACLSDNKQRLSAGCFKVFDRGEPAAQPVPHAPAESKPYRWGG